MSVRALSQCLSSVRAASVASTHDLAARAASVSTSAAAETDSMRRILEMEQANARVLAHEVYPGLRQPTACSPRLSLPTSVTNSTPKPDDGIKASWRDILGLIQTGSSTAVLKDTFGRAHTYLRISLTERCNLRCQYCMPAEGIDLTPREELLTAAEIGRLARIFVSEGVDKIRLTGGEPTLRKDLQGIAAELGSLPGLKTLAMTSNGVALRRKLPALRTAGLSALNISLDTLQEARFEQLTRRKGAARVLACVEEALAQGFAVKVNVVVMRGVNDDELADFVELTRHRRLNVRFIEYMPFDDNAWSRHKMYTFREMRGDIEWRFGAKLQRCNDAWGEVAKNFELPGFAGSVSFVTSMTEHFCAECNRVRLLADGALKVCLFGASEVSLRDAMREGATDEQLRAVISAAIKRKKFAHADMDVLAQTKNRTMIQIGG
eukprot:jgi/Ulvmu1/11347/UM075_0007.1